MPELVTVEEQPVEELPVEEVITDIVEDIVEGRAPISSGGGGGGGCFIGSAR